MTYLTTVCSVMFVVTVTGCASDTSVVPKEEPAVVEPIDGTSLNRIVLTESAVDRLGVQTTPVTVTGDRLVVPVAAVIIDPEGRRWVYTNPEPRVYVRAELESTWDVADQTFFDSGPDPGTVVVTVGVPELYGAEFGLGK